MTRAGGFLVGCGGIAFADAWPMASARVAIYNELVAETGVGFKLPPSAMAKVLTVVAAIFFLGGLALTVGYVANQIVLWRMHGTFSLEHVHYFYIGGTASAIGMITLALLEIRMAILFTIDHEEEAPAETSAKTPAPKKPRAKQSWKKSADVHRSFLGPRDSD